MILNQFGRRNISSFAKAELALQLKPLLAEQAKVNQGARTDILLIPTKSVDTRHDLAKEAGVSTDAIFKTEKILKNDNEELIEKVRDGENTASSIFTFENSRFTLLL